MKSEKKKSNLKVETCDKVDVSTASIGCINNIQSWIVCVIGISRPSGDDHD